MGELKVRRLDDHTIAALKARAKSKGISLEEEVRTRLVASVAGDRSAMRRRLAAVRAAGARSPYDPALDSLKILRELRDDWG
jgi:plasmid stability protein